MTKYVKGQDIVVDFDGIPHQGEVIDHRGQWVMATIQVDVISDYGRLSPMMSPQQTVCVPEARVKAVEAVADTNADTPNTLDK